MISDFDLNGRTALVTGGGRGIGRAIALTLAEAGSNVAIASRTQLELDEVAAEIKNMGRLAFPVLCDIVDPSSVDQLVSYATNQMGGIDILVNNAGINGSRPLTAFNDDNWDHIMKTNLSGPFYCCRAVARHMMEHKSGRIINISSTAGVMASPGGIAYNTSKAGLNMLTKVLATELAPYNIGVNGIGPGWFATEMTKDSLDTPEKRAQVTNIIPMKRLTDIRDLGLLAVYLASPASNWMTGQVIYLDGGQTAAFL